MCNWKNWIWPGLITTALLTALTGWFLSGPVEADLTSRAGEALKGSQAWSTVSFDGRDATISGVAEGDPQISDAAKVALGTYGVRVVANAATLPPKADPFVLNLVKDAAGVTLKGNYDSSESRAAIVAAAEKAMPGIAVKDEMTLASGKPEGFDALAAFGAGQLADLTSGEVSLSNLDYSIKGAPVDLPTYEKAIAAAAALPAGGALKMADLSIPNLGKPYEFNAVIDGGAVNLTGYAPSAEAKAAIEADAKAAFPDKTITNGLKLAGGAPENYASFVKFGFGQMAAMGNGSVSIVDTNYSIKGTPADPATFEAVTKAAKDSLPAGATLVMADIVKPAEPAPAQEPAPEPAPAPAAPYVWTAQSGADGVKVEGSVPTADVGAAALDLAKRRFVKSEVTDAQTVLEGAPEGFADAQGNMLRSMSYLTDAKSTITDKKVTLEGTAPSEAVKKLVTDKATAGMPAGFELAADIKVVAPAEVAAAPVALEPYVWTAVSNADGLKLEGSVLSADVGRSILEVASSSFGGKAVTNAQAPRNPSPAGFAAAQSEVLKGLAQLQEGNAKVMDQAVSLTGVAATEEIKAAVTKSVTDALPEGYALTAAITVPAPPPAPEPAPEPAPAPAPVPYVWAATTGPAGVKVEGSVPSTDVSAANLDLAKRRFVKSEVTDAQTVLEGAPEAFPDSQAVSLKALSYLTEGKAMHSDKTVDITGIAPSEAVKALVIKNATANMPQGYALTTNITVVEPPAPAPAPEPAPAPAPVAVDCVVEVTELLKTGQINFETNKSIILDGSKEVISKIGTALGTCPAVKIEVVGHTDSDGSNAYNNRLSQDRARAVRKALVAMGVEAGRIKSTGLGETAPIAGNDTEENKAKNRRIEFRAVQ